MFWNVWQSLGKLSEWLYSSLDTTIVSCIAWTARGLSMLCPAHDWTIEHDTSNIQILFDTRKAWKALEKQFILNKSRETCKMYQTGDQWPVWAGHCCLSSSRLSWFSENFSPPATDHPPSCAVYCVCTSQAHYNADDTAAAQWSFMSWLFTPSNTNNVCSLHIFAFHRLYQIKCCGCDCWFY